MYHIRMKFLFGAKKESGISLLLALMLVSFTILLVVFAASIGAGQIRSTGSSADSARAFTAADTGIEYALSRINLGLAVGQDASSCQCGATWCAASSGFASNEEYCVTADNPSSPRKITAVGRTTDTKIRRSLEILLPAFAAVNTFNTFCINGVTTLNLNAECVNRTYAGATGVMGTSATSCNSAMSSLVGRTVDNAGVNTTLTGLASGNFYTYQCYR